MIADPYMGHGLKDKNGTPINCGDSVKFLGGTERIARKKWDAPDGTKQERLALSAGFWLTPYSAGMCEVLSPSNESSDGAAGCGPNSP